LPRRASPLSRSRYLTPQHRMLLSFAPFRALATSLLGLGSPSTVQVVGDAYLDIIAKIDELPQWDGDTAIRSPIETVAGGSALNTAVQLSALCRTRRQRDQPRPFRRCVLHSRVGSDLYGELVAAKTREAGVTLSARREGGQGVCICLSGRRDRAFVSFKGSVADLSEEDLDVGRLLAPGTSHLHFSAYYDCSGLQPAVPRLMARAKAERGATVSIVPQTDATGDVGDGGRGVVGEEGGLLDLLCSRLTSAHLADHRRLGGGLPRAAPAHRRAALQPARGRLHRRRRHRRPARDVVRDLGGGAAPARARRATRCSDAGTGRRGGRDGATVVVPAKPGPRPPRARPSL